MTTSDEAQVDPRSVGVGYRIPIRILAIGVGRAELDDLLHALLHRSDVLLDELNAAQGQAGGSGSTACPVAGGSPEAEGIPGGRVSLMAAPS